MPLWNFQYLTYSCVVDNGLKISHLCVYEGLQPLQEVILVAPHAVNYVMILDFRARHAFLEMCAVTLHHLQLYIQAVNKMSKCSTAPLMQHTNLFHLLPVVILVTLD